MGLFNRGIDKIETDPCIMEIVNFFIAVKGITEKSEYIMSWADIYSGKNEIVCRYFDNDKPAACYYAEQIEVYGRDNDTNNKLLYESVNGKNLPKGTKISFEHDYTSLQLFLTVTPLYPRQIKQYGKVIAKACQERGIVLEDWSNGRVRIALK